MTLELKNVVKRVGAETHIHETSLTLATEGFNVLLGATGAGKTTLIKLMAGLEQPTSGEIWFNGENVTGRSTRRRNVSHNSRTTGHAPVTVEIPYRSASAASSSAAVVQYLGTMLKPQCRAWATSDVHDSGKTFAHLASASVYARQNAIFHSLFSIQSVLLLQDH